MVSRNNAASIPASQQHLDRTHIILTRRATTKIISPNDQAQLSLLLFVLYIYIFTYIFCILYYLLSFPFTRIVPYIPHHTIPYRTVHHVVLMLCICTTVDPCLLVFYYYSLLDVYHRWLFGPTYQTRRVPSHLDIYIFFFNFIF